MTCSSRMRTDCLKKTLRVKVPHIPTDAVFIETCIRHPETGHHSPVNGTLISKLMVQLPAACPGEAEIPFHPWDIPVHYGTSV